MWRQVWALALGVALATPAHAQWMAQKEENDRMLAEMKAERRGETAPASGAPTKQKVAAAPRPSAQPRATQVRRKPQQKKK